jgi:hypothetical protein
MPTDLQPLMTAANEAEAALMRERLSEAGIGAIEKLDTGVGIVWNAGGARTIYVERADLDAARELFQIAGE